MSTMRLFHSCCPAKRDINPPELKRNSAFTSRPGTKEIQMWQCEGCGLEIVVGIEHDAKP